jgi:hypothetical protein
MKCEAEGCKNEGRGDLLAGSTLCQPCYEAYVKETLARLAKEKCITAECPNMATCEPEIGWYLCDSCYEQITAAILDRLVEEGELPHRFHSSVNEQEMGNA